MRRGFNMMGDRGDPVRSLQSQLVALGYMSPFRASGARSIDGIFGAQTDAAVRTAQRAFGLAVDGIVGPKTRAALGMDPAPEPTESPGAGGGTERHLPSGLGLWIHRLHVAWSDGGSRMLDRVRDLGVRVVHIKVLDGRSRYNEKHLGAAVEALKDAGVEVSFWQWVYCVWTGSGARTDVAYVQEQAAALGALCNTWGVSLAVANVEGDGWWSTSRWGTKGQANRARWGQAAEAEVAARATAYVERLRATMPAGTLCMSTHGLPSSQALPWEELSRPPWDVVMPQIYYPKDGWSGIVERALREWHGLGVTGLRLRFSGGIWEPIHVAGAGELSRNVRAASRVGACAAHLDWWTHELAGEGHVAALRKAMAEAASEATRA